MIDPFIWCGTEQNPNRMDTMFTQPFKTKLDASVPNC
jgi:hypothetical protein